MKRKCDIYIVVYNSRYTGDFVNRVLLYENRDEAEQIYNNTVEAVLKECTNDGKPAEDVTGLDIGEAFNEYEGKYVYERTIRGTEVATYIYRCGEDSEDYVYIQLQKQNVNLEINKSGLTKSNIHNKI